MSPGCSLPPDQQVRGGHNNEQPPGSVADTRFHHHRRPSLVHGNRLSSHRALIGVANKVGAELDSKWELLGTAVESAV